MGFQVKGVFSSVLEQIQIYYKGNMENLSFSLMSVRYCHGTKSPLLYKVILIMSNVGENPKS